MKLFSLLLLAALAGCASMPGESVLGTKPTYLESTTEAVPNAAALSHRI